MYSVENNSERLVLLWIPGSERGNPRILEGRFLEFYRSREIQPPVVVIDEYNLFWLYFSRATVNPVSGPGISRFKQARSDCNVEDVQGWFPLLAGSYDFKNLFEIIFCFYIF